MPAEPVRLFIALPIPVDVRAAIEAAQSELRASFPEKGAKWTKAEQFHLTLRFLGDVDESRVPARQRPLTGFISPGINEARVSYAFGPRLPRKGKRGVAGEGELRVSSGSGGRI